MQSPTERGLVKAAGEQADRIYINRAGRSKFFKRVFADAGKRKRKIWPFYQLRRKAVKFNL
jgi:glutamate synthase domain-containing protein 1